MVEHQQPQVAARRGNGAGHGPLDLQAHFRGEQDTTAGKINWRERTLRGDQRVAQRTGCGGVELKGGEGVVAEEKIADREVSGAGEEARPVDQGQFGVLQAGATPEPQRQFRRIQLRILQIGRQQQMQIHAAMMGADQCGNDLGLIEAVTADDDLVASAVDPADQEVARRPALDLAGFVSG